MNGEQIEGGNGKGEQAAEQVGEATIGAETKPMTLGEARLAVQGMRRGLGQFDGRALPMAMVFVVKELALKLEMLEVMLAEMAKEAMAGQKNRVIRRIIAPGEE